MQPVKTVDRIPGIFQNTGSFPKKQGRQAVEKPVDNVENSSLHNSLVDKNNCIM